MVLIKNVKKKLKIYSIVQLIDFLKQNSIFHCVFEIGWCLTKNFLFFFRKTTTSSRQRSNTWVSIIFSFLVWNNEVLACGFSVSNSAFKQCPASFVSCVTTNWWINRMGFRVCIFIWTVSSLLVGYDYDGCDFYDGTTTKCSRICSVVSK